MYFGKYNGVCGAWVGCEKIMWGGWGGYLVLVAAAVAKGLGWLDNSNHGTPTQDNTRRGEDIRRREEARQDKVRREEGRKHTIDIVSG